jgi:hypothetical protein
VRVGGLRLDGCEAQSAVGSGRVGELLTKLQTLQKGDRKEIPDDLRSVAH